MLGQKAIKDYTEEIARLKVQIGNLKTELNGLLTSLEKAKSATRGSGKETRQYVAAQKQAKQTTDRLTQTEQEIIRAKLRRQEATKQVRLEERAKIQIEKAAKGSTERYTAGVRRLEQRLKKVNQTTKAGRAEAKRLKRAIDRVNGAITQQSSALTQQRRNIGNYKSALGGLGSSLKSMAGMFLGVGAAMAGLRKLGGTVKTFAEFEQATANLASVSQATSDEMLKLSQTAREVGGSSIFTAKQVVDLQTALAKLGFTTKEIDASTDAISKLAAATGEDLALSAEIGAKTLRGFQLDASESSRVVDVMAASFTKSGLSLQTFQDSMKSVSAVAASTGNSLEFTTAILGKVVDNGVEASTAGSQLRNIFLELEKQGLTLGEAMEQIRNSSQSSKTAMDLFGKRAAPVALIMSKNEESIKGFAKELENSGGIAERMANKQLDTLQGKTKILNSAWESLSITLNQSGGFMKNLVGGLTDVVSSVDEYLQQPLSEKMKEEQIQLNGLVSAIQKSNDDQQVRNELINTLQAEYPDFLANLDAENLTNEQLAKRLQEVNKEYEKKIEVQAATELRKKLNEAEVEAVMNVGMLRAELEALKKEQAGYSKLGANYWITQNRINDITKNLAGSERNLAKARRKFALQREALNEILGNENKKKEESIGLTEELRRQLVGYINDNAKLIEGTKDLKNEQELYTKVYQKLIDAGMTDEEAREKAIKTVFELARAQREAGKATKEFGDKSAGAYADLRREISRLQKKIKNLITEGASKDLILDNKEALDDLETELKNVKTAYDELFKEETHGYDRLKNRISELQKEIPKLVFEGDMIGAERANLELEQAIRKLEAIKQRVENLGKEPPIPIELDIKAPEKFEPASPEDIKYEEPGMGAGLIDWFTDPENIEQLQQAFNTVLGAYFNFQQQLLENQKQANQERLSEAQDLVSEEKQTLENLEQAKKEAQKTGAAYDQAAINSQKRKVNEAEKAVQREKQAQKRLAKEERKIALKQAIINIALGVTKALSQSNFIQAAALAIAGGLQIATIKSTKFKEGGTYGAKVEGGKSHSQGGNKELIETESGELKSVFNRDATSRQGKQLKDLTDYVNAGGNVSDYIKQPTVNLTTDNGIVGYKLDALGEKFDNMTEYLKGMPIYSDRNITVYRDRKVIKV